MHALSHGIVKMTRHTRCCQDRSSRAVHHPLWAIKATTCGVIACSSCGRDAATAAAGAAAHCTTATLIHLFPRDKSIPLSVLMTTAAGCAPATCTKRSKLTVRCIDASLLTGLRRDAPAKISNIFDRFDCSATPIRVEDLHVDVGTKATLLGSVAARADARTGACIGARTGALTVVNLLPRDQTLPRSIALTKAQRSAQAPSTMGGKLALS
mmetsp:Transcript_42151/g.91870  ORF Transcript_42151/g.91870 Transcript_42151/m.91870 type:complete len:211 (+) Transcript_42151:875-1507(+)